MKIRLEEKSKSGESSAYAKPAASELISTDSLKSIDHSSQIVWRKLVKECQNIASDLTVKCKRCKCQIHLLCYDIGVRPEEIPVARNILILCDEFLEDCLSQQPSPKRKTSQPNYVQQTLNGSKLPPAKTPPSKINQPSTQKLIESLQAELKNNTATISALKSSVDSMHGTMTKTREKESASKSCGVNDEDIFSIKTSLAETQNLIESIKKQSYSNVVKGLSGKSKANRKGMETPRSSRTQESNKPKKPVVSGTSNHVIGKPLSPMQQRKKVQRKILEKGIWISRLHRDTSVEEMSSYVKDNLGIAEELDIRKLVKKDRPITEYTFVSFRISCSNEVFDALMDVNKWPSYCQVREFQFEMTPSRGAKLNEIETASPKNGERTHDHQPPPPQVQKMDTI